MAKIIKFIAEVFGFFLGADGFWKDVLFPEKEEANLPIAQKRGQFPFLFRPLLTSLSFCVLWLLVTGMPRTLAQVLTAHGLAGGDVINSVLDGICTLFDSIKQVIDTPLNWLAPFFPYNPLFALTTTFFYTLWYRISRKWYNRKLIAVGQRALDLFPSLNHTLMEIYIENAQTHKIKLSPKWAHMQTILNSVVLFNFFIFYVLNIVSSFATGFFWEFSLPDLIPFTGFLCFMEAYHYLSFADTEQNRSRRDVSLDLAKLRVDYQKYAQGHSVHMVHEYRNNHAMIQETLQTTVDNYAQSNQPDIKFLYQYLEERQQLEHMDMAVHLIQGKNIFYASPFYRDIDACIFYPIFQSLLRQQKGLILVEDNENLAELVQWLSTGMNSLSRLRELWNVAVLQDPVVDVDVGILPFQSCFDHNIDGLNEFLEKVSFVVVLEASNMLVGGQESIITLAERIRADTTNCTWLLCDWNAESMLDLFSHLLKVEFTYVSATPVGAMEAAISYWDVESEPDQIWTPAKRFLGLEVGIAEVAGKNQVPHMIWYGEEWMPVIDMNWIISQYYQVYSDRIAQPVSQTRMKEQIQCYISAISCGVEQESFLVVEDSCCNLYEVGRQYVSRGRERVYVHVLSPNYLLRDFMKSRSNTMLADPKYIAQFVPEYVNSSRNVYLHLLRELLVGEVTKQEIHERLMSCEDAPEHLQSYAAFRAKQTLQNIVQVLLDVPFQPETDIQTTAHRVFSEEEGRMVRQMSYHITSQKVQRAFHKYFRQARYMDETGEKRHINRLMLAGHLELKFLPGQYTTLNGKYYQVEQLLDSGDEILLVVKRASEQVIIRRYYRQLRTYRLKPQTEDRKCETAFSKHGIILSRLVMDFEANTTGYLVLEKQWNDLRGAQEIVSPRPTRCYFRKQVLRVDLPANQTRDALFYLAAVIHDMFYTLYPQYCYLLSVAVCWRNNEASAQARYRGVLSALEPFMSKELREPPEGKTEDDEQKLSFYIFEDSCEDMGLLQSIERHFLRIIQIAAEYTEWENGKKLFFS